MDASLKNADRFSGFADLYENARPKMPLFVIEIVKKYLGRRPDFVVDLGCGTGLSTVIWKNHCRHVVGIEPNDDMFAIAEQKADAAVSFQKAYAHETGLNAACADAIICSQSFHWMHPDRTLSEVNRTLKPGGIFATVDCDWPPVFNWQVEKAYSDLRSTVKAIEREHPDFKNTAVRWDKNQHLTRIIASGYFRYCREIVFASTEDCDAERLIAIALSQSGIQRIHTNAPDLIADAWNQFTVRARSLLGYNPLAVDFCYRMRIGIK